MPGTSRGRKRTASTGTSRKGTKKNKVENQENVTETSGQTKLQQQPEAEQEQQQQVEKAGQVEEPKDKKESQEPQTEGHDQQGKGEEQDQQTETHKGQGRGRKKGPQKGAQKGAQKGGQKGAQKDAKNEKHETESSTEKEKEHGSYAPEKSGRGNTSGISTNVEQAEKSNAPVVLEKGKLFFFYRPKVEKDGAHSAADVQRLYFAMSPDGRHKKHRLIVVGSKRLPDPQKRSMSFGYVDYVADSYADLEKALHSKHYETETRGERDVEGARLCGEARYEIVTHHQGHTHLMYVLEIPEKPSQVQHDFHIQQEQTILVQVRNPHIQRSSRSGFGGLSANQKAEFPPHLQERFSGKRTNEVQFTHLVPEFLDHLHAEMLLVGVPHSVKDEFGKVADDLIKEAHIECEIMDKETSGNRVEAAYEELKIKSSEHPDATQKFV